jgi:excisionase family DNA binding protein
MEDFQMKIINDKEYEKLYRSHEAGIILNVNRQTIRRWINDGKINAIKTVGGHNRIPASEIDRLLSNSSGGNLFESASEFDLCGKDSFKGKDSYVVHSSRINE